jgi:hypothetical protein
MDIEKLKNDFVSNMDDCGHYGDYGNFYITEPSKRYLVDKINEIIEKLNLN